MDEEEGRPILTAVSSSARQLYQLLRCINFAEKAHVQIDDEGIKFSVDEASAMEGTFPGYVAVVSLALTSPQAPLSLTSPSSRPTTFSRHPNLLRKTPTTKMTTRTSPPPQHSKYPYLPFSRRFRYLA